MAEKEAIGGSIRKGRIKKTTSSKGRLKRLCTEKKDKAMQLFKNLNLYAEHKTSEAGQNMKSSTKFSLDNFYRND